MVSSYKIGGLGKLLNSKKLNKNLSAGVFAELPQQQLHYKAIKFTKKKIETPDDDFDGTLGKKGQFESTEVKLPFATSNPTRKRKRDFSGEGSPASADKFHKKRHMSDAAETDEKNRSEANDKVDPQQEERTVFIGNLPATAKKKSLCKIFKAYGTIECTRFRGAAPINSNISKKHSVIKKKFHPEKSNIIAYIRFSTKVEAEAALAANGVVYDGLHIRVDSATPKKKHDNKRSVFVGNLPFNVTEEALFEHFMQCGEVEAVRIIRDGTTGAGKGFGYVLFKSSDAVEVALHLNERPFQERKIRVKRAINTNNNRNNNVQKKFKSPWKETKKNTSATKLSFQGSKSDEKVPTKRDAKKKKKTKKTKKLKQKKVFFPDVHKKKS